MGGRETVLEKASASLCVLKKSALLARIFAILTLSQMMRFIQVY